MKRIVCCFLLASGILLFAAEGNKDHGYYSPGLSKRVAHDTESSKDYVGYTDESNFSNFDREKSNTYKMSITPPTGGTFIPESSCSGEITKDEAASVEGRKLYSKNSIPTSTYIISISGQVGFSGTGGSPATWGAYVRNKYFWIEASGYDEKDVTVAEGTTVQYVAKEKGNGKNSNWTVSKFGSSSETKNNAASITFNRVFWGNIVAWFTNDQSVTMPTPGIYTISAVPDDDTSFSPAPTATMTVVGGNFTNVNCPGYDNYTNWSQNAVDYYDTSPKGKCTNPYIAVEDGGGYDIRLNLTPTPIVREVNITENDTSISHMSPEITKKSTDISFLGHANLFSDEGEMKAELDGATIAIATICAYKRKTVNILFVKVNGQSGVPNYSAFNKAVVTVNTATVTYRRSSITVNGTTHAVNSSTVWTLPMLEQLRDDFYSANPNVKDNYTHVQFQMDGNIASSRPGFSILGRADNIPSRDSWVSAIAASNNIVYPHELGHCLKLWHIYELDSSGGDGNAPKKGIDIDNLMHPKGGNGKLVLRKNQWDDIKR